MWERRFVDVVLRLRVPILVAVLVLTGLAGWSASSLKFSSDIEIWFLENDPNLVRYKSFLERFEADEITVVGVFAEDVFQPKVLAGLEALTEGAEQAPHVHRARSLTNIEIVQSQGPGSVSVAPLYEALPEDAEEVAELRARAMASTVLRGNLVSADGKATALIVELDAAANNFEAKVELVEALRVLTQKHLPEGVTFHLAGTPPLDEAFFAYTKRDMTVVGSAAFGVVILVLLLLFRRVSAVAVALPVVGIALIWMFGLMAALGLEINLISQSLGALILAVGVADSVHVISDYYQQLGEGHGRDEAVRHSTATLLVPCLFTSATTAAGFLSLLTSNLQPIAEFGWLAAIGVGFAFLLSMTFVPCALSLLPEPKVHFVERQQSDRLARLLTWMASPSPRRARVTLALSTALVVLGAASLSRLSTEANPMNYFLPNDPVRVATEEVDRALGGSTTIEFLVTTPDGGLKDPKILARMEQLETRLESLPGITSVLSVLDSLRETRRVFMDGKKEFERIPGPKDHPHLAAQLYFVLEQDRDFAKTVQGDYSITRMTARVRLSEASELTKRYSDVEKWMEELGGEGLAFEATGYVKLMGDMEHYLFSSQIRSLLVAFVVITLMMFLLLRSWRLGLFSMIPNFVPILLGLAFMALAGIALDPGTVMIGSLALGLVVDDTVHYLVRVRRNLDAGSLEETVARSLRQTGRPIMITTLVLALGYATLGLGTFAPNVAFGLVSAVVITLALVADLVILPAALLVLRPRL